MHLKSLILKGFKSFADKSALARLGWDAPGSAEELAVAGASSRTGPPPQAANTSDTSDTSREAARSLHVPVIAPRYFLTSIRCDWMLMRIPSPINSVTSAVPP